MEKDSLSGFNFLKIPPWSKITSEDTHLLMIHAAVPEHNEAWDPCGCMPSNLLSEASEMPLRLCFFMEPRWCKWHIKKPETMLGLRVCSYWGAWVDQPSCSSQGSCWCLPPMLLPMLPSEAIVMSVGTGEMVLPQSSHCMALLSWWLLDQMQMERLILPWEASH